MPEVIFSDKPLIEDASLNVLLNLFTGRPEIDGHPEIDIGEHLVTLYNLALQSPTGDLLELGVRGGISTQALGLACKQKNYTLWSVDCDPCPAAITAMETLDLMRNWCFLQEDDRNLEKVMGGFSLVPPYYYGLIFIDTSHEYDHTKKEIELYSPRVAGNGFMVFHDSYLHGNYYPGVSDPINEFLDNNDEFKMLKVFMNCNGLTILRKK